MGIATLAFMARAQDPPPLLSVVRVKVKPDRLDEWREITKRYSEARRKRGGGFRHVWRSRLGNLYEYVIVTPMQNYAERDSPGALRRGMSEGETASLAGRPTGFTGSCGAAEEQRS